MIQPIRILQIVTQMNRAGMESRLMDLYRNIDKEKIQFDFYTCREESGVFDDEIRKYGGKIYYNKPLTVGGILSISKRFKFFFKQHKEYKIVHCHLNQWSGIILHGAKSASVPIRIAHSRTGLKTINKKNFVKNIIKIPVNSNATHRFAVSKEAAEWLFGKKATSEGGVIIWPNAIDITKFKFNSIDREEYRSKLNIEDDLTLIHVGNIRPEKNHEYLLNILLEVLKRKSKTKLLIVGKDYLNEQMQKYAEELGITNNIHFLGSRSDVSKLLNAADVFVFPSLYEGFPGAVLEAQASGLPCFISNTITDEVVLHKNVKKMDINIKPEKWAEKILDINPENRHIKSNELKENGYDILETSKKMEDFYLTISKNIEEDI